MVIPLVADEKNCEVLSVKLSTLSGGRGGGDGGVGEPGADEEPPPQPTRISDRQVTAQCKGLIVWWTIIQNFARYFLSLPAQINIGQQAKCL